MVVGAAVGGDWRQAGSLPVGGVVYVDSFERHQKKERKKKTLARSIRGTWAMRPREMLYHHHLFVFFSHTKRSKGGLPIDQAQPVRWVVSRSEQSL